MKSIITTLLLVPFFCLAAENKDKHDCEELLITVVGLENVGSSETMIVDITIQNPCKQAVSHVEFCLPDGRSLACIEVGPGYEVTEIPGGVKFEVIGEGIARGESDTFTFCVDNFFIDSNASIGVKVKNATNTYKTDLQLYW